MTIIHVTVKPNSRTSELAQLGNGTWQAKLKSPPVDGKANAELVTLLARHFGRPKSSVSIKRGSTGRVKVVTIAGD